MVFGVSASGSYSNSGTAADQDFAKSSGVGYALLVGVSMYKDPSDYLAGVQYDAPHVSDMLINDCGYSSSRITTLTDNQATKVAIRSALTGISSQAGPDDTFVFYFSGHGKQSGATSALLPYDLDSISSSELKQWLDGIQCKKVLVIIDACEAEGMMKSGAKNIKTPLQVTTGNETISTADRFSTNFAGTFDSRNNLAPGSLEQQKALTGNRYVVLAACRSGEGSWTDAISGSFFTSFFVEGMGDPSADTNFDNWVSAEEAFNYAAPQTTWESTGQHPVMYDGDPSRDLQMNYYEQLTVGRLSVSSGPSGATIYLDGTDTGFSTPATLMGISAGSHTVVLKKSGYLESSTSVNVAAGQTASVSATLNVQPTTGSINIKSTPAGATILLDGMNKGTTPATLTGISTGSHTIILKKSGYSDSSTSVTIAAGQTASVSATLIAQSTTGSINIKSTPPGATILLDGMNKGTSPVTLSGISTGSHTIILKKSGYSDSSTSVIIAAGQTASVSATLIAQSTTGSINIKSTPAGATILLDGVNKGTTPAILSGISTGSHTVVLKKSGYSDYSTSVTVAAGQTASVSATLNVQSTTGSINIKSTPAGATILLDGMNKGTSPVTLSGISTGSHTVILKKSGYSDSSTSVTIADGQTASVSVTLNIQSTTGSINIISTPAGATILLDGMNKGTTPATLTGISPGSHTAVLKKNGYTDSSNSVTVSSGQTASLSVTLNALAKTGSRPFLSSIVFK